MRLYLPLAALGASLLMIPTASADVVFDLNSVQLQYGGTLSGSFTTNDALNSVTSYDIVASAGPGSPGYTFTGFTYDTSDSVVSAETKTLVQFDATAEGNELRLAFAAPLSAGTGAVLSTKSYESELVAGNRSVSSGSVVPEGAPTSVTPEPSSIALLGTGLLAVAGVVRKRLA